MAERILYLDGVSGISGDMTVGALLALGADQNYVQEQLAALGLDEFTTEIEKVKKGGLSAFHFHVLLKEEEHGHHEHRTHGEIQKLLADSRLDEPVKALAQKIFCILAKAEGKVHGVSMEEVHFHEVGAVDSIVDTVAAAAAFVSLRIDETVVGTLREGCGTTWCQHGEIPVPVPAVAELVKKHGLRIELTKTKGEMITPTGAALAAAFSDREELPGVYRILEDGYGAGTKEFPHPNVLRAMLLETDEDEDGRLLVLETNVDDCSGEQLGFLQEQLFKLGVMDVWMRPIYMKKNRPAYLAADAL